MREFSSDEKPFELRPTTAPIWVQAYQLPFMQHTLMATKAFGDKFGTFVGWDDSEVGHWDVSYVLGQWLI